VDVVGVGRGVRVGAGVDADVEADEVTSAISSSAMSISVEVGMMGSETGVSMAAASWMVACVITDAPRGAVSAAERDDDGVGRGGAEDVFLVVRLLDAGRLGQVRESCPTSLHRGHALSEPGHEAKTLKPSTSKKGVAERDLPTDGSLITMSQRLVVRGKPLTV
jgi:hypothetical protein